ncbi:hypothetical protein BKA57DRAFT_443945 [Linnemannia elongata]|nr:hypothetical protein BKA57DRAFT_443945 [Linnemannia elongata]
MCETRRILSPIPKTRSHSFRPSPRSALTSVPLITLPFDTITGNPTDLYAAHGKLEQWLLKIGDKEKVRFYIDGLPAAEKVKTHTNRHQSRQKALIKASTAISSLESRLAEGKRIRKLHITGAHNPLRQAFHWSLEDRMSFVEYMANKGYDIILCPTESDVLIAAECHPDDAVISCDSDLLFYKTVPVVWRPVGSYKARTLTALAIVSGNDYVSQYTPPRHRLQSRDSQQLGWSILGSIERFLSPGGPNKVTSEDSAQDASLVLLVPA